MNEDRAKAIVLAYDGCAIHVGCLGVVDKNNFCHGCNKKVFTANSVEDPPSRARFKEALRWFIDNWGPKKDVITK